jgi:hypothetical protein
MYDYIGLLQGLGKVRFSGSPTSIRIGIKPGGLEDLVLAAQRSTTCWDISIWSRKFLQLYFPWLL